MLEKFDKWIRKNYNISDSSKEKYKRAVNTVSNEMLEHGTIHKSLLRMNIFELDLAIMKILNDNYFKEKNNRGNNMYSSAIKKFRLFILENSHIERQRSEQLEESIGVGVLKTERESIVNVRLGQRRYRGNILKKYDRKCIVTKIDKEILLVASHIKPWSVSDDCEKVDTENGLLLSSHIDKLFDSGLITFNNNGKMKISSYVGKENEKRLNISSDIVADLRPSKELLRYLEYHQDKVYIF